MFDPSCTLLYKCLLNIIPTSQVEETSLMQSVLSSISEQINIDTGLLLPSDRLQGNFSIESQNRTHRLLISHVASEDNKYPVHWAIRIKSADPTARYRIFTQHIGIRQTSPFTLSVHIASTSSDHLGGRFAAFRPPLKKVSTLVERLFSNADIRCVTGNHILLSRSMRLTNQSIEYFLNLLYEKTRTLPVVLVTCPDLIDPDLLHSHLIGNAVVCSTGDPGIVMLLNDYLPEPLRIAFGSIRIYVPFDNCSRSNVYHPIIPLSDIYRITPVEVIHMLYRAYAENFRQSELKTFVTTDTCSDIRTRQYINSLNSQLSVALESLKNTNDRYSQLQAEYEKLSSESLKKDVLPPDEVYESLIGEYSTELTLIKDGIQYLMAQTCGNSLMIDIPEGAHSLVVDLIKSVNFRQMRPRSKPRKSQK